MPDRYELCRRWAELAASRGMDPNVELRARQGKDGVIYIAKCGNGHHESYESPEHAITLLLESFEAGAEDEPKTHAAVMARGGSYADIKVARSYCAALAKRVHAENPEASREQLDAIFKQALQDDDKALAEAHKKKSDKPPKGTPPRSTR